MDPPDGRTATSSDSERERLGMNKSLGARTWVATSITVLAAVSACSNSSADPPPSTSSANPSPSRVESSSPSMQPSKSDDASSAARALMRRYFAVTDQLGQHLNSSLAELKDITVGSQRTAERVLLESQRRLHERQTGDTRLVVIKLQSIDLDNSKPSAGKVPTALVDVCWDVSNVDVVDRTGSSIVSPNRPDKGWTRYTLANYHYKTDRQGGWRVASGQDLKQAPCASH
jgi:hypothetical protein